MFVPYLTPGFISWRRCCGEIIKRVGPWSDGISVLIRRELSLSLSSTWDTAESGYYKLGGEPSSRPRPAGTVVSDFQLQDGEKINTWVFLAVPHGRWLSVPQPRTEPVAPELEGSKVSEPPPGPPGEPQKRNAYWLSHLVRCSATTAWVD